MPPLYKIGNLTSLEKRSVPVSPVVVASKTQPSESSPVNIDPDNLIQARLLELRAALSKEREAMLAEIEALKARVRAEAYREGYVAGQAAAREEAEVLMTAIREAEQSQLADREIFIESCQEEITELVLTVTESLIKSELHNPERVMDLVSRAINELVSRKKVIVFVHPGRLEEISAHSYLLPAAQDDQEILFRADPTLGPDVFRVEDDRGSLVVDLPRELVSLRQELGDD
jgi:flagellar assembly protein FliH